MDDLQWRIKRNGSRQRIIAAVSEEMSNIARITREKLYDFIYPNFVSYHSIRQIMDD